MTSEIKSNFSNNSLLPSPTSEPPHVVRREANQRVRATWLPHRSPSTNTDKYFHNYNFKLHEKQHKIFRNIFRKIIKITWEWFSFIIILYIFVIYKKKKITLTSAHAYSTYSGVFSVMDRKPNFLTNFLNEFQVFFRWNKS